VIEKLPLPIIAIALDQRKTKAIINMNEHILHHKSVFESVRSKLVDFTAKPVLLETIAPTALVESREVHHSWSLYNNNGAKQKQSVTAFGPTETEYYGSEGWPQNGVGTSHAHFSEGLQIFEANGSMSPLAGGVTQKVSGQIAVMLSGLQLTSGRAKQIDGHGDFYDTPAAADYYITLTIRRQRVSGVKFHLWVLPIRHAFDAGGDVGQHTLRVFDDSTSALSP
jgi:hypothetical protein